MDATRARRTRDRARQTWYARCRQQRFARFLGFPSGIPATNLASQDLQTLRIAADRCDSRKPCGNMTP